MKAARLLKLMHVIRSNPELGREEVLARLGETSDRQFYLDRKALAEAGFRFKWSRREGRFVILDDPFVENVELQMSEALALGCAVDALARGGETELALEAKKGLERLLTAARPPDSETRVIRTLLDNIVETKQRRNVVGGAPLDLVVAAAEAMIGQRELRIRYVAPGKEPTDELRPIQIHFLFMGGHTGTAIYADAYCPDKKVFRTFRLSRVAEWEIGKAFQRQPEYSFSNRFKNCFQVHGPGREAREVVLYVEPEMVSYLTEKDWHPSRTTRVFPDGSAEVSFKVSEPREVLWWSLLWEGHVYALKPSELVDEAKVIVDRFARNYAKVLKTR